MKRFLCAAACAALLGPGTAARAEDWAVVGLTRSGTLYIDLDSVEPRDQHRKAWVMWDFPEPLKSPGANALYRSTRELWLLDCRSSLYTVLHGSYFPEPRAQGKPVDAFTVELKQAVFQRSQRGTPVEVLFGTICKPPKAAPAPAGK